MSYETADGRFTIYFSPSFRGAPDSIRDYLETFLRTAKKLNIASQQVSDRGVVNAIAYIRATVKGKANVLLESDYLFERKPVPDLSVWRKGGDREENRQCFLALIRAGVKVRPDQVGGSLQHVNLVITQTGEGIDKAFITSANLSPGSIDKHFNWALSITDADACDKLLAAYKQAWDGDFRDVELNHSITTDGKEIAQLMGGAKGQAINLAVTAIESAQTTIKFAYFNMSRNARVTHALIEASRRGVNVAGIVDGDQKSLSWDAVPDLKESGVHAFYYPGALTGAMGRMHYKMLVIDDELVHLSTANASHAAESSFELGITIFDRDAGSFITNEIIRLTENASYP